MHVAPPAQSNAGRSVLVASADLLSFVIALQKRHSDALGFLPAEALRWYVDAGRVRIVLENGEPAGYVLGRSSLACSPRVQPITQTAVCFDAQRRHLGLLLVEQLAAEAAAAGRSLLQAWCRVDLQANDFWRAAGFLPVATRRPANRRGFPLILWRRPIDDVGRLRLLHLPRRAGHLAAVDRTGRLLRPADLSLLVDGRPDQHGRSSTPADSPGPAVREGRPLSPADSPGPAVLSDNPA